MHVSSLFMLTAIFGLVAGTARAEYTADFSLPAGVAERTIVGSGGWEDRLPSEKAHPDTARVVPVRWNDGKPALMMKGANLKCAWPPVTGSKVTITFDLAVTCPDRGGSGRPFRIGFGGAPPCGEIFLDMTPEGGLGYQADGSGRNGTVVLNRGDLKPNSFYRFTVVIDYQAQMYDFSITGTKKDGSPFSFQAPRQAFEAKRKEIGGTYILNPNSVTAYLGSLTITSE
jgi:hypothetical protein